MNFLACLSIVIFGILIQVTQSRYLANSMAKKLCPALTCDIYTETESSEESDSKQSVKRASSQLKFPKMLPPVHNLNQFLRKLVINSRTF